MVNDGSTDDTAAIVHTFAAQAPEIRLIENPGNCGKGYSVRKGEHGTKIVKFVEFISKDNAKKVAKAASAPRVYTVFERGQVDPIVHNSISEAGL